MPEYLYRCIFGHEISVIEPMETNAPHICEICGGGMWRKPQPFSVNWNGLKPSAGELPAEVQAHVDNADEIRERTDEFYERRQGWINTEEVHHP